MLGSFDPQGVIFPPRPTSAGGDLNLETFERIMKMEQESDIMKSYRVYMHTQPSPGATFYRGSINVYARNEEEAEINAKDLAKRSALHTCLVVDKIEVITRGMQ